MLRELFSELLQIFLVGVDLVPADILDAGHDPEPDVKLGRAYVVVLVFSIAKIGETGHF